MSELRVVIVTAPTEGVAKKLADLLLAEHLVACANIINPIRSIYRWQGKIEDTAEVMMILKTTAEKLPLVEKLITANHPYSVPEIVSVEPRTVNAAYLKWVLNETAPPI